MFELQVRPIDHWPRAFTKNRKRGSFTQNYGSIMRALEKELEHLGAKSSVLLVDLREEDIRIDGRPRANAKPSHPGIILVVETRNRGTLRFPCDAYDDWTSNLRAISLHLDALRRIDRYGVSVSGEQYAGWKALPPANGDHRTKDQHAHWLVNFLVKGSDAGAAEARANLLRDVMIRNDVAESALRDAERKSHPDKGGNASDFHQVQQARKALLGG